MAKNTAFRKAANTANQTLPQPARKGQEQLIVNQVQFHTTDLTPKDIGKWSRSWEAAISSYYPNRTRLYDLYAKILNDTHLSGIITKRIGAVTKCRWVFERDHKKEDSFDSLIRSAKFRELLGLSVWTKLWGQSGLEFIPGGIFDFHEIPRKHIKQKWGIIAENENDVEGFNYLDVPNLWIMGKADDVGLLNKCAPMVIYKTGNWGDWAQYIEVFGQPMRIFKYDAFDPQGKKEIQEAAANSGGSMALTIPRQADFDVKDGKATNGDGKLQDAFKNALNAEMSVCILGNTETTVSSSSSGYAQSNTHGEQQNLITLEDIVDAENMLNNPHFLAILQTYGYHTEGGRFVCLPEIDLAKVKTQVEIIKNLRDMGTPVADEHLYEITGIPKPADYNQLKASGADAQSAAVPATPKDESQEGETATANLSEDALNASGWKKMRSLLTGWLEG